MPKSTLEVQEMVRWANRENIPIVLMVSQINISGTATPDRVR
ncbi:MAG: hypothetical protein QW261_16810 [Candidatus Jordarchaeaceae archaeon]